MNGFLFDDGEAVLHVLAGAPLMYLGVILLVRAGGKRTTSQMNNFDWVVTVAMGALVATGIVSRSVPLGDTLLAVALLVGLQYAMTTMMVRSDAFAALVKPEPRLLVRDGRFLPRALAAERVSESEVRAVVRRRNIASLDDVAAVVLETDGTLSVLTRASVGGGTAPVLADVEGPTEERA